ncbi:MAG TPA: aldo/keto reductase [Mycobacteriales bacterium]|nr:aldo/keto reductase [Mycobacteriales bacterium]
MAIPTLEFGSTGHRSTRLIFGAAALAEVSQEVADRTLGHLLDHGINHIDTAAGYGDSELRIAPWLRTRRDDFFLATKSGERTATAARAQLEDSLRRLEVDHVDLWQFHNLADPIEWDIALSPGGIIEAAEQAKKDGLVRFVGVTGHGSQIAANHRRSLERYAFDSVLLPYNYVTMQNSYYAENFDAVQATCQERGIAVQTIKSAARRPWRGRPHTRATWYEPYEDQDALDLSIWYALAREGTHVISLGDVDILPRVLDAAERFEDEPTDEAMAALSAHAEADPLFV